MSNTKRVGGTASGGQTKRIAGLISASITQRTELPAIDTTGGDAWGGAWGSSWGSSWGSPLAFIFPATRRVTGVPAGGDTNRVGQIASYFLLEGDETGVLLLEGDVAGYGLGLEGDETDLGGTVTKRVVQ